jgi:hypothetical protein
MGVFASCHEASVPFPPSPLGFPTAVLDDFGVFFQAELSMATDLRGLPIRPGPCDQEATGRGGPAWVIAPGRRCAPEEYAEGIRPRNFISARGFSNRVRSPIAATRVTATVHGTPRNACRASTTGDTRQAMPCSWRACSRRWRRSRCAVTARTYSCKTMCCAGVGHTTAESHRRGAGFQWARPPYRISCRSKKALRRNVASVQSLMASSRARVRSRMAASSPVGT